MITRKFSIAHWDAVKDPSLFAKAFINSSQEFKDSIADIYFGHAYHYDSGFYGDVMDTHATSSQIDELFNIQDQFNVPISLTLNETIPDIDFLTNAKIQNGFIEYLKKFYDRGLRICTIGDTHLINSGRLQREFPEMRWKNTVNHLVRDAQGVIDYAMLGYDTILINRNLHRDLPELKRIKKAVDWFNSNHPNRKPLETSLLVTEGCILNCPWKSVHDYHWPGGQYFNIMKDTCSSWRSNSKIPPDMPRNNPDAYWYDRNTFEEFAKYVDTFKYIGRLTPRGLITSPQMGWVKNNLFHTSRTGYEDFDQILEKELLIHQYLPGLLEKTPNGIHDMGEYIMIMNDQNIKSSKKLNKEKLKTLDKVLRQCRGQCWNCHKCEEAYETNELTSLIGVYK